MSEQKIELVGQAADKILAARNATNKVLAPNVTAKILAARVVDMPGTNYPIIGEVVVENYGKAWEYIVFSDGQYLGKDDMEMFPIVKAGEQWYDAQEVESAVIW